MKQVNLETSHSLFTLFVAYYLQEDFLQLVHKETILVGHSLENDLLALKISHRLVIDTAVLYKHSRGGTSTYKISLRVLTRKFLAREIQNSIDGHDSVEDARATMELALLKIRHGKCLSISTKTFDIRILIGSLKSCFSTIICLLVLLGHNCFFLLVAREKELYKDELHQDTFFNSCILYFLQSGIILLLLF